MSLKQSNASNNKDNSSNKSCLKIWIQLNWPISTSDSPCHWPMPKTGSCNNRSVYLIQILNIDPVPINIVGLTGAGKKRETGEAHGRCQQQPKHHQHQQATTGFCSTQPSTNSRKIRNSIQSDSQLICRLRPSIKRWMLSSGCVQNLSRNVQNQARKEADATKLVTNETSVIDQQIDKLQRHLDLRSSHRQSQNVIKFHSIN